MVHLSPLRLYRVRDAPEETLCHRQGDIRVRLPTKLPERADIETQVLWRNSGTYEGCPWPGEEGADFGKQGRKGRTGRRSEHLEYRFLADE
jgi:hypothetical protein